RPPPPSVVPPVSNRPQDDASGPSAPSVEESVAGYQLVSDDRLLFVPPYPADSPSPPRDLLPPGPAVLLSIRLAGVVQDPTGSALIAGMSPELQALIESAADRAKLPVGSIRRLAVAMHPGKNGWPEVSLAVELEEPILADALLEKLAVGAARTRDNHTIYVGDEEAADAYYWPDPEGDLISRYAVGSIDRISEVASLGGGAIPLPRSSQSLWDGASDESELVVLFTPNFLFADGRALLTAAAPESITPLKRLMQPDVAAALVTVNLSDQDLVFIEARFAPSGGISEAALMRNVTDAIQSWPDWADRFILESVPDASWRLLASRLPSMMRFVASQARFGISNGAVVANAYLPAEAFPQVTLATILAMNTPLTADASTGAAQNQAPLTIDQMLDREMTVSFDQESLEFALEAIVNAFREDLPPGSNMPPARIIGGDLQLMGITQNQQVRDFAKTNEPLRAVLTDLVVRANPDKSATGPADPKQSLIWVIADASADPETKEILITTRQAAKSKNYELPKEFRIEPTEQ
ncbi:MAG: serine/threonine protein kinase, partial [Planctomycetes bacterium]|nr:serine/threonine protein kinase [Planctomycetota bacterium]